VRRAIEHNVLVDLVGDEQHAGGRDDLFEGAQVLGA
jgi:hypothetical protein